MYYTDLIGVHVHVHVAVYLAGVHRHGYKRCMFLKQEVHHLSKGGGGGGGRSVRWGGGGRSVRGGGWGEIGQGWEWGGFTHVPVESSIQFLKG